MTFRELFKQQKGYDVITNNPFPSPAPTSLGMKIKTQKFAEKCLIANPVGSGDIPEKKAVNNDSVNHPSHYTKGGIECIDAIEAATDGLVGYEAVCTAQVIKYIWRWKWKNGIEDLKKARWYLDRLIAKVGKK